MKITIADLGSGNLHSLKKALERLGASVCVSMEPAQWISAEVLALPGDGAFGAMMESIGSAKSELRERIAQRPTLGICVGMQILFDSSDEDPVIRGLSLLSGHIARLEAERLPHMGWNTVTHNDDPIFGRIPQSSYFYFVHSYASHGSPHGIAWCECGSRFDAVVRFSDAGYAVQFHPEKSGQWGLKLLENYLVCAEAAR